jgi:hypothetical protein
LERSNKMRNYVIISLRLFAVLLIILSVSVFTGCDKEGDHISYNPHINPADFTTDITNPYMPMVPGTIYTYEAGTDSTGFERTVTEVTNNTRDINGVTCRVVRDRDYFNNNLVEETYDWFAQDNLGNVWYFGELALQMENGMVIDTEGSWEYGADDAQPGIWMKAAPVVGETYRQEYQVGVAEDMVQVESTTESFTVPYGSYENCLKTKEWSNLEPGAIEHKIYASGVGLIAVLAEDQDQLQLISITTGN